MGHGSNIHPKVGELCWISNRFHTNSLGPLVQFHPFDFLQVSFCTSITRSGRFIFYQLINFWLLIEIKYSHVRNRSIFIASNCWQIQAYICFLKEIYSTLKLAWQLKTPISFFLKARYSQTKHLLHERTWQLATPISSVLEAKQSQTKVLKKIHILHSFEVQGLPWLIAD